MVIRNKHVATIKEIFIIFNKLIPKNKNFRIAKSTKYLLKDFPF